MENRHKPRFPQLGEFKFIERLLSWPADGVFPGDSQALGAWQGPGDDCGMLGDWLISTDQSVEGTHFRLDWADLPSIIEKCVLSNLSDINAKGGVTGFALLNICLRKDWNTEVRQQVADTFAEVLARYRVRILGGDTVCAEMASFGVTVFGKCMKGMKPLLRSAAKPGHHVYVSGRLGASAAGLWALQQGIHSESWNEMIQVHHLPKVPLGLGAELIRQGVDGASIDLSDGLSSELHHICAQSQVGMLIYEDKIPVAEGLLELCEQECIAAESFILNGGEEYQILFTSSLPPSLLILKLKQFNISWIGSVVTDSGVTLVRANGEHKNVLPGAWSHI
jgi:thiamine-monophosphate kinase